MSYIFFLCLNKNWSVFCFKCCHATRTEEKKRQWCISHCWTRFPWCALLVANSSCCCLWYWGFSIWIMLLTKRILDITRVERIPLVCVGVVKRKIEMSPAILRMLQECWIATWIKESCWWFRRWWCMWRCK